MSWFSWFKKSSKDPDSDDWSDINKHISQEEGIELAATVEAIHLANEENLDKIRSTADDILKVHFEDLVVLKLLHNTANEADAFFRTAQTGKWSTDLSRRAEMYADQIERVAESAKLVKTSSKVESERLDLAQKLQTLAQSIRTHIRHPTR